jgi:hypothetical protein
MRRHLLAVLALSVAACAAKAKPTLLVVDTPPPPVVVPFATGAPPIPVTFGWNLDPTHDPPTTWEVEIDGAIKPCLMPKTMSAYRQCTADVVPGLHTYRMRGTNEVGPPIQEGGPPTVQVGAWSTTLSEQVGIVPGTFSINKSFESTVAATAAVTWKDTHFTYVFGGEPLVANEGTATVGNFELIICYGSDTTSLAIPFGWTPLPAYSGQADNAAWRVGYLTRANGPPSLICQYEQPAPTFAGAVVIVLQTAADARISIDAMSVSGQTGINQMMPNASRVVASNPSLAMVVGMHYGGIVTIVAPPGYTEHHGELGDFGIAFKVLAKPGSEDPQPFGGTPTNSAPFWNGFAMTFKALVQAPPP